MAEEQGLPVKYLSKKGDVEVSLAGATCKGRFDVLEGCLRAGSGQNQTS